MVTTTTATATEFDVREFRVIWNSGVVICETSSLASALARAAVFNEIALKAEPSTKVQYRDFDGAWLDVEDLL